MRADLARGTDDPTVATVLRIVQGVGAGTASSVDVDVAAECSAAVAERTERKDNAGNKLTGKAGASGIGAVRADPATAERRAAVNASSVDGNRERVAVEADAIQAAVSAGAAVLRVMLRIGALATATLTSDFVTEGAELPILGTVEL
jgi:hypothetical protein